MQHGGHWSDHAQGHYHDLLCLFTCKDVALLENPGGQKRPPLHMMEQVGHLAAGPEGALLGCCLGCSALRLGAGASMLSKRDEQKTQMPDPDRQLQKRETFRLEVLKRTKRSVLLAFRVQKWAFLEGWKKGSVKEKDRQGTLTYSRSFNNYSKLQWH